MILTNRLNVDKKKLFELYVLFLLHKRKVYCM